MRTLVKKLTASPLTRDAMPDRKLLINTLNANSINVCLKDNLFREAILKSDVLLPDGVGAVLAASLLDHKKHEKTSGYDLFIFEMKRINEIHGKCFFLGSSDKVLSLIRQRAEREFPGVIIATYSPPYKAEFSDEDNSLMINAVNSFSPDVLFVGMTAPKQEKWAARHFDELDARHICSIGAVFDFYAGTVSRAPGWMVNYGLEWFYRLIKEPMRMWRRYIIGNTIFLWNLFKAWLRPH
jgi:N-acetylglucosaminyldiphosphoundecaprenol N-acetyl-beta-D-mannosaminyltransferase